MFSMWTSIVREDNSTWSDSDATRRSSDSRDEPLSQLCDRSDVELHASQSPNDSHWTTTETLVNGAPKEASWTQALAATGYQLLAPLTRTEAGGVVLGMQVATKRMVAIKVLVPSRGQSSRAERFGLEAQLLAHFEHPNLVKFCDFRTIGRLQLLVMEYVPNPDLRRVLHQAGEFSCRKVAEYIRQAALALDYLHQHGVIHRDVKPANLAVGRDGYLKLLDLGLARDVVSPNPSITLAYNDCWLGTPDYMAPEQITQPHLADERADIYALGASMFQLLTGRVPFPSATAFAALVKHQQCPVPNIAAIRPDAPVELTELCCQMLAKRPQDRPQTASAIAAAMGQYLSRSAG